MKTATTTEIEQTELYQQDKIYWMTRIDEFPPSPQLPSVSFSIELQNQQLNKCLSYVDKPIWDNLKFCAQRYEISPIELLITLFVDILYRYSGSSHFSIKYIDFDQLMRIQVNENIDNFNSFILLEADLRNRSLNFLERAIKIQEQIKKDFDHFHYTGIDFLEEFNSIRYDVSSNMLSRIAFTSFLNCNAGEQLPVYHGLKEKIYDIALINPSLLEFRSYELEGKLVIEWDYIEECFPKNIIEEMHQLFCQLLEHLSLSESSWQLPHWNMILSTQLAKQREYNCTNWKTQPLLLHEGFFLQAKKNPKQTAIISHNQSMTYEKAAHTANQIAHYLKSQNIHPNELVAIVMNKDWHQIVSCLGVLASGGAYLPIDADLPEQRIDELLRLGKINAILTQRPILEKLTKITYVKSLHTDRLIVVGDDTSPYKNAPTSQPAFVQKSSDLAYVIFTSGSTGIPKGVMIEHGAVMNTILDMNERFNLSHESKGLALSSLSFDLSVYDIFGLLTAGGTIIVPTSERIKDPSHWVELIAKHRVNTWNTVPMFMQMLVEFLQDMGEETQQSTKDLIKLIMLSGDWIPTDLPDKIFQTFLSPKLVSLGGATEASIWSIIYEIREGELFSQSIPYGYPLRNQKFYVLDPFLDICPDWVRGELFIGGIGLARGYLENDSQTTLSFIDHPQFGRLYKTGDLGRFLPSGAIEFLGRNDSQVKIRGYRVELGEIETALNAHPDVQHSIVLAKRTNMQDSHLLVYLVPSIKIASLEQKKTLVQELQNYLKIRLPSYMVPTNYIVVDQFPLTPNGKINKSALLNLT